MHGRDSSRPHQDGSEYATQKYKKYHSRLHTGALYSKNHTQTPIPPSCTTVQNATEPDAPKNGNRLMREHQPACLSSAPNSTTHRLL